MRLTLGGLGLVLLLAVGLGLARWRGAEEAPVLAAPHTPVIAGAAAPPLRLPPGKLDFDPPGRDGVLAGLRALYRAERGRDLHLTAFSLRACVPEPFGSPTPYAWRCGFEAEASGRRIAGSAVAQPRAGGQVTLVALRRADQSDAAERARLDLD